MYKMITKIECKAFSGKRLMLEITYCAHFQTTFIEGLVIEIIDCKIAGRFCETVVFS